MTSTALGQINGGVALKKTLYEGDLFIVEDNIPAHQDSRTNTNNIIDYAIFSPAIHNKIQNLSVKNDISSDHSAILFNFSTKFNKSVSAPIKIKLYQKTKWDSINSSLSNKLAILQNQISHLINS